MKKYKIEKYHLYIPMVFTALFAILNLFEITYWTRNGWTEPSFYRGIVFLIITIGIYLFVKYKTKEPDVYTCGKCDNAFWDTEVENKRCPICGKEVVDIKEYYKKWG